MKYIHLIFLFVFINTVKAQSIYPFLAKDDKWGFVDSELNYVVEPTLEYAHPLIDGRAAVMKYDLWGYIDENGKLVISYQYYDLTSPSEGLIAVQDAVTMKWGYIDYQGNVVLDFIYDDAGPFKFNLAPVAINGSYQYIDKTGKKVYEGFKYINPFNEDGYSMIEQIDGAKLIFDKTGKKYLSLPVYYYELPSDGMYLKIEYGRYGFVSIKDLSLVIPCQYSMAYQFKSGLAPVRVGDKWGYINKKNEVVIDFIFDDASVFSEGLAAVKVGDKKGYIDQTGKTVIEPKYNIASDFQNGVAEVELNDLYYYITEKGVDLRE